MGLVLEWVYGTIVSTAEKARDSAKKPLGALQPHVKDIACMHVPAVQLGPSLLTLAQFRLPLMSTVLCYEAAGGQLPHLCWSARCVLWHSMDVCACLNEQDCPSVSWVVCFLDRSVMVQVGASHRQKLRMTRCVLRFKSRPAGSSAHTWPRNCCMRCLRAGVRRLTSSSSMTSSAGLVLLHLLIFQLPCIVKFDLHANSLPEPWIHHSPECVFALYLCWKALHSILDH